MILLSEFKIPVAVAGGLAVNSLPLYGDSGQIFKQYVTRSYGAPSGNMRFPQKSFSKRFVTNMIKMHHTLK